jgi:glycosyltransferase
LKVSVITVCYNSAATIEGTISSVLNQTYKDIEYLIIDGNSTDETLNLIEPFKNRVKHIISEPDQGIFDAMNKGLQLATGNLVCILNSDDVYENENIIENIVNVFNSKQNVDAVYANIIYVDFNDLTKVKRRVCSSQYYPNFFEDGYIIPHPSLFIKKEILDRVGLYDLTFKSASDYEYLLRIFKIHKVKSLYLNSDIVRMRQGGYSNKSLKNIINANREILKAWNVNNLKPGILFMFKRVFLKFTQLYKTN